MRILYAKGVVSNETEKACIYLISLLCLAVMFTACYYLSYLHALKNLIEMR